MSTSVACDIDVNVDDVGAEWSGDGDGSEGSEASAGDESSGADDQGESSSGADSGADDDGAETDSSGGSDDASSSSSSDSDGDASSVGDDTSAESETSEGSSSASDGSDESSETSGDTGSESSSSSEDDGSSSSETEDDASSGDSSTDSGDSADTDDATDSSSDTSSESADDSTDASDSSETSGTETTSESDSADTSSDTADTSSSTDEGSGTTSTGDESDSDATTSSGDVTSDGSGEDTTGTSESDSGDDDTTGDGDEDDGTPAAGIAISAIEINQGVAIPIWADDAPIAPDQRNSPLVEGREMLVRVSWSLEAGWSARDIEARLALVQANGSKEILVDRVRVTGAPNLDRLDGSFHWVLEPDQVQSGVSYSVGLFEVEAPSVFSSVYAGSRVPENSGKLDLGVPDHAMEIEIKLVPMVYQGTGPVVSDAVRDAIADGMYLQNALMDRGVTISWRDPIDVDEDNLNHMLDRVTEVRAADDPEPHVYYAGLCDSSVAGGGLAWVAGTGSPWAARHRASASGIRGANGTSVVTHEVGHNQGLKHNPGCGAAGPEPTWPYEDDSPITSQGYNLYSQRLYDGQATHDYMSYCHPWWVSDFSYEKSGRVIEELTRESFFGGTMSQRELRADARVLRGLLDVDGSAVWSIVAGAVPEGPLFNGIVARLRLHDGHELEVHGQMLEVSSDSVTGVAIELPVDISEIAGVDVQTFERFDSVNYRAASREFLRRFPHLE